MTRTTIVTGLGLLVTIARVRIAVVAMPPKIVFWIDQDGRESSHQPLKPKVGCVILETLKFGSLLES